MWVEVSGAEAPRTLKRALRTLVVMLVTINAASAAYNWFYTDALTSNNGHWYQNGSASFGGTGLTSASGAGLVYNSTAPVYPNDYQVQATINLPNNTSGGKYG